MRIFYRNRRALVMKRLPTPFLFPQAIGRDAYPGPVVGLSQNLLTRGVVRGRIKQRESSNLAVEDMLGEISSSET